ncbi:UNVERIFIED_CONTAM: hypothetical protein GTU68_051253, partial [Idotea baltica]|nr:hypothetical protein [Idotea baltica]
MVLETESSYLSLKEKGNAAYKDGNWEDAISYYTQGLKLTEESKEKYVLFKNRAAVYLKKEEYENVIKDSTEALEIVPKDPKALFRRAQAYEKQENYEKAYADARATQSADPKNKEVQVLLERLHKIVQTRIQENTQTSGKIKQMFEILFDPSNQREKRETAASNLVALAKERSGAELLLKEGVLGRIVSLLKAEQNAEVRIGCTRTLTE